MQPWRRCQPSAACGRVGGGRVETPLDINILSTLRLGFTAVTFFQLFSVWLLVCWTPVTANVQLVVVQLVVSLIVSINK